MTFCLWCTPSQGLSHIQMPRRLAHIHKAWCEVMAVQKYSQSHCTLKDCAIHIKRNQIEHLYRPYFATPASIPHLLESGSIPMSLEKFCQCFLQPLNCLSVRRLYLPPVTRSLTDIYWVSSSRIIFCMENLEFCTDTVIVLINKT